MTISHTNPVGEGEVREKEEKGKCRGEPKVWGPIGAWGRGMRKGEGGGREWEGEGRVGVGKR